MCPFCVPSVTTWLIAETLGFRGAVARGLRWRKNPPESGWTVSPSREAEHGQRNNRFSVMRTKEGARSTGART